MRVRRSSELSYVPTRENILYGANTGTQRQKEPGNKTQGFLTKARFRPNRVEESRMRRRATQKAASRAAVTGLTWDVVPGTHWSTANGSWAGK